MEEHNIIPDPEQITIYDLPDPEQITIDDLQQN